jgi:trehalose-6-phosphate synthase
MPLDERRTRHEALFQVLMTNDVESWGERFLIALTRPLNLQNWLGQTDFSQIVSNVSTRRQGAGKAATGQ